MWKGEISLSNEDMEAGQGKNAGQSAKALRLWGKPTPDLIWSLAGSDDGLATLQDAAMACDGGTMSFVSPLEEGLVKWFLATFKKIGLTAGEGGACLVRLPIYIPSTHHLWFGWQPNALAHAREKVICLEAATNLAHDSFASLYEAQELEAERDLACCSLDTALSCMSSVRACETGPADLDAFAQEARDALRAGGESPCGEWLLRNAFAFFVEELRLPFRCEGRIQSNASAGLVVVDIAVPPVAAFETLFSAAEGIAVERLHAIYCLSLAAGTAGFMARAALGQLGCPTGQLERIVVNCCDYEADDRPELRTWLSLDLDTEHALLLSQAISIGGETAVLLTELPELSLAEIACETGADLASSGERDGLVAGNSVRFALGPDGALSCVPPYLSRTSPDAALFDRWDLVESRDDLLPPSLAALAGCERVRDMGCIERFARVTAWESIVEPALRADPFRARKVLEDLRVQADNLSVVQACTRLLERLGADGTFEQIEPLSQESMEELEGLFVESSPLDHAAARGFAVLEMGFSEKAAEAAEKAIAEIERLFAPLEETGYYDDDATAICRWFEDTISRILFNRFVWDGKSPVKLVPNDVYRAVNVAAILYRRLDEPEKALEMARRQTHMAPTDYDGYDTQAMILLDMSRPFEAIATLLEGAKILVADKDCALYYYRMAYAQKSVGRVETAVACYLKAGDFDSPFQENAEQELEELLEDLQENGGSCFDDLDSVEQADAVIEREGLVPPLYGQPARDLLLSLAVACTERGLFRPALVCLGTLLELPDLPLNEIRRQVMRSLIDPR